MNRKAIISLTVLIIFCVIIGQMSLSFAYYPTTIVTSGIIKEKAVEPIGTKRHVIAYTLFTSESADFVTSNFDMVIAGFTSTISEVKALNPDVIVLGYRDVMAMHSNYDDWNEVNSHEDWFLHDVNGNRLIHRYWGWYAMDIGNTGWRSHYANYVKDKLDSYLFDGVFADDVWDSFFAGSGWNPWTAPIEDVPVEIKYRWHGDMLEMIRFVKESISEKLLIINTSNNDDYVDACDGKMHEGFVHSSWWALEEFHDDTFSWNSEVESLKSVSQKGKYFLAQSGTMIPDNPTEADIGQVQGMMIYCLSSYFLGVSGGNATFGFNSISSGDGSRGYYPEFDVSLGSPTNEYYSFASVYARDFTDGKVLVNPTALSYTVHLGVEYKTLDDQILSSLTLDAHSGVILLSP